MKFEEYRKKVDEESQKAYERMSDEDKKAIAIKREFIEEQIVKFQGIVFTGMKEIFLQITNDKTTFSMIEELTKESDYTDEEIQKYTQESWVYFLLAKGQETLLEVISDLIALKVKCNQETGLVKFVEN